VEVDFKLNQAKDAKGRVKSFWFLSPPPNQSTLMLKMEFEHQIKNNITFNPLERNVIVFLLKQLLKL
jgi:hypothetical protein